MQEALAESKRLEEEALAEERRQEELAEKARQMALDAVGNLWLCTYLVGVQGGISVLSSGSAFSCLSSIYTWAM